MILRGHTLALALIAACVAPPRCALAEAMSLFGDGAFLRGAGALAPVVQQMPAQGGSGPSLFAGRDGTSLFAPVPQRVKVARDPGRAGARAGMRLSGATATFAERIRDLIGYAEAGRLGYDAVQHGAKYLPPRRPTDLTIGEIYAWIAATPGQPHAIGRYQFIPDTLERLVSDLGVDERAVFSPELQDRLADLLLEEAGLSTLAAGAMDRRDFMNNLAQIWAGLPTSSGKSHYHGYAGNRATMTWAQFDAEMGMIFPG